MGQMVYSKLLNKVGQIVYSKLLYNMGLIVYSKLLYRFGRDFFDIQCSKYNISHNEAHILIQNNIEGLINPLMHERIFRPIMHGQGRCTPHSAVLLHLY